MTAQPARCPWCGARLSVVAVHGHGQCAVCGTNVDPCCAGAGAGEAEPPHAGQQIAAEPHLFERVLDELGGRHATVTGDALAFALAQRQGVDLDEARLLMDAGLRVGKLLQPCPGCYRLAP